MGAHEQGANATDGRWLTQSRTLCFICHGDDVLLMKRSPQRRVFPNRYNGVGGHIERHEDPLTSVQREAEEETGLTLHTIRLRAIYNIDANEATGITLFVFTAGTDSRDFTEDSREGTLHWVRRSAIYQLDLVDDLREMLPRVLMLTDDAPPLFVHASYDDRDQLQLRIAEQR